MSVDHICYSVIYAHTVVKQMMKLCTNEGISIISSS